MGVLVRSLMGRSRPVCEKVSLLSTSCFFKRLDFSGSIPTFLRRTSASVASPHVNTQTAEAENQKIPFERKEFLFYHAIMERSPKYKPTIFSAEDVRSVLREAPDRIPSHFEKMDWSEDPAQDVLEAFRTMAAYAVHNELSITDPKLGPICNAISSRLSEYSSEELLEIAKLVANCSDTTLGSQVRHYRELIKKLNDSWVSRYQEWNRSRDVSNILKASDVIFWMRNGNRNYLRCIIYHMASKVQEPHHLLQLMFYLGLIKPLPATYKCYDLEKRIFAARKSYSLEELIIFVHSLFRAKSHLQYHPLLEYLLIESLKHFSSLNDNLLVTVCKGFNGTPKTLKPLIEVFQQKVLSRINVFKIETIIHVLWMCASNNVINEEFAQTVFERALNNIGMIRWKELSRMIIMFAELPHPSRDLKQFGECAVTEMTVRKDIQEFMSKKLFIQGAVLHRLLLWGLCPRDLLDVYLDSVNSDTSDSRALTCKEALGLDVHLEVFYPQYEGTRLKPEIRKEICEQRFKVKSSPFQNSDGSVGLRSDFNAQHAKRMYSDILTLVGSVEENTHFTQLVPSFGYLDYVLRLSKDGTYLPIPNQIKECEGWKLPYIPIENLENGEKFVALTFFGCQEEFIEKKIVSIQNEKTKILEKLGYTHIQVAVKEWSNVTPAYKQQALKSIIEDKLSEKS